MLMNIVLVVLILVASYVSYRAGKSAGAREENERCSTVVCEMKEVVDQMIADTSAILNSASAAMSISSTQGEVVKRAYEDYVSHGVGTLKVSCSPPIPPARYGYPEDHPCCAKPGEDHPCSDCPSREHFNE